MQPESRNSELLLYLATMKIIIHIGKLQGIKCNIAYKDICQKHPLTSSWIHFFKKQTVLFLSCISLTSMLCCRLTKSVGGKGRAAGLPEQGLMSCTIPPKKTAPCSPCTAQEKPKAPFRHGKWELHEGRDQCPVSQILFQHPQYWPQPLRVQVLLKGSLKEHWNQLDGRWEMLPTYPHGKGDSFRESLATLC